MEIIPTNQYSDYIKNQPITLLKHFNKLKLQVNNSLDFYNTLSAVYSSIIEGSRLLVSDYMKIKGSGMNTTNKDYKQVNDLIKAYEFAQKNELNYTNFLKVHTLATITLIQDEKYQGNIRDKEIGVYDQNAKLVYTGCAAIEVETELHKLFNDIDFLQKRNLSYNEVFYYASMIHLLFVKIHPFADGNGRTGRLIEKWFIASKLGVDAWKIQNEKLYQKRTKSYYKNLEIGLNYKTVNYNACIPFLKMLPMALRIK